MRRVSVMWLCFIGLVAPACQMPTDPDSTDDIEIELTSSPTTAMATAGTGVRYLKQAATDTEPAVYDTYDWETAFTVNIVNSETIGHAITAINVTARQASGGIIVPPSGGDVEFSRFSVQASGNRVEANGGTTAVGVKVWYDFPLGLPEALITVAVSFKDDDDVTFIKTIDVRVQG